MSDVLTPEERGVVDDVREGTFEDGTRARKWLLAIVDRLAARLTAAEAILDAMEHDRSHDLVGDSWHDKTTCRRCAWDATKVKP